MTVRLLAGDIGGTKTILRLEEVQGDTRQVVAEVKYPSADFEHLNPMVEQFLADAGGDKPNAACLAIAGPVVDDRCQVTNLNWQLDARQMETALNIPKIRLINDFAAVGYGILALQPEDVATLQTAPRQPQAPIAVLGAGTGLGEALLVWQQGDYQVLPLEGGHTDFPARNDLEMGLLQYLMAQLQGRVSVERVVCGQGLLNIYSYLRDSNFAPESPDVVAAMANQDPPAIISQYGLNGGDRLCATAMDMFVSAYGAEAGNLALKSLPYGGLYVAGGIAPKIITKLKAGGFMDAFLDKGRMLPLLEKIPVSVILNAKVGLLGAALYAQRLVAA